MAGEKKKTRKLIAFGQSRESWAGTFDMNGNVHTSPWSFNGIGASIG